MFWYSLAKVALIASSVALIWVVCELKNEIALIRAS